MNSNIRFHKKTSIIRVLYLDIFRINQRTSNIRVLYLDIFHNKLKYNKNSDSKYKYLFLKTFGFFYYRSWLTFGFDHGLEFYLNKKYKKK